MSTPQLTAIVVVPAPPLAPKNTSVVRLRPAGWRLPRGGRRSLQRLVERTARGRPGKELVGARAHRVQDEIGIRLGRHEEDHGDRDTSRAAARPVCSEPSRSARPSTKMMSGGAPARAERSSPSDTCTAVVRSSVATSVRNESSRVWREPVSRAMSIAPVGWTSGDDPCGARARHCRSIAARRLARDPSVNVVARPSLEEEADPVHHLRVTRFARASCPLA